MPGSIPWANLYVDQIWLNSQFELALLNLYTTAGKIPYDPFGYGLIRAALVGQSTDANNANDNGPINNALNNGVIQTGVTLSSSQAAQVNAAAGATIAPTIQTNGYYLQILDPGATARNAGATPIINFWYTSGGSVLSFSMGSITIL